MATASAALAATTASGRAIDLAPLRELVTRISARWRPTQIWLFGSRARGDAHAASDWDLLVVVPDEVADSEADDPMVGWRLQQGSGVRADVIACRVSDFRDARTVPNTLAYEAFVNGVLLHDG